MKIKKKEGRLSLSMITFLSITICNNSWGGSKLNELNETSSLNKISSVITTEEIGFKDDTLKINQKISKDIESRILKKKNIPSVNRIIKIPKIYGESLYNLLNTQKGTKGFVDNNKEIKLNVTIKFDRVKKEAPNASMSTNINEFGKAVTLMNGKKIDDKEIERQNKEIRKRSREYVLKKKASIRKSLKLFKMTNTFIQNTKALDKAIEEGKNSFEIVLKKGVIQKFIDYNSKSLVLVSLAPKASNCMASAMLSTNIDPWALNYSNRRGNGIGIYISESKGCPANNHISNYMRLGDNISNSHSENVTGIIRAASPDSYVYCKRLDGPTLPNNSDRAGHSGNPEVLVESYSFAYLDEVSETYTNHYRSEDKDWDNEVLNEDMIVIVAAGNDNDLNVSSPGKGFNVITVGNYNDDTDTIATSSDSFESCFSDPETGINKPEISAPGTNITAGGHTMSGTSMAAPHVAAFTADLLSRYSWLQLRPSYFKALLLASATKSISGGVDKVGVGGIDFYNSIYNGMNFLWTGTFSYIASHDGGSDNSKIEKTYNLTSGRDIRVAISWLNDGDYTLNHRTDNHPIGKDYDLVVYDPDGNYVGGSWSWDNSYETVNFHTNKSGNYRFVVSQYIDRDTSLDMFLGMSIHW